MVYRIFFGLFVGFDILASSFLVLNCDECTYSLCVEKGKPGTKEENCQIFLSHHNCRYSVFNCQFTDFHLLGKPVKSLCRNVCVSVCLSVCSCPKAPRAASQYIHEKFSLFSGKVHFSTLVLFGAKRLNLKCGHWPCLFFGNWTISWFNRGVRIYLDILCQIKKNTFT